MNRSKVLAALLCCAVSGSPAFAADQSVAPPAPAAPASAPAAPAPAEASPAASPAPPAQASGETSAPAASGVVIPAGTLITVELTDPLSASKSKEGEHFGLRLAEPITIGGVVVVPAGATGLGDVVDAKAPNIGGRAGRLVLAARFLDAGPLHLKLQSLKLGGGGRDRSALAVDATIAIGLIGALVPGGNIDYPVGTRATAKIAADVTAPPADAPPAATAASTPPAASTPSP